MCARSPTLLKKPGPGSVLEAHVRNPSPSSTMTAEDNYRRSPEVTSEDDATSMTREAALTLLPSSSPRAIVQY